MRSFPVCFLLGSVQFLITSTLFQEVFPAASYALTIIVLSPTRSGIELAVQVVVPLAVPDAALDCQTTFETPILSDALPLTSIVVAVVLMMEPAGEVMLMVGAVRSIEDAGAAVLVTVTICTAAREESVAVTVTVLIPTASGIAAAVQFAVPLAVPLAP